MVVDGNGKEFLAAQSNRSCLINDGNGLIRFKKVFDNCKAVMIYFENR